MELGTIHGGYSRGAHIADPLTYTETKHHPFVTPGRLLRCLVGPRVFVVN